MFFFCDVLFVVSKTHHKRKEGRKERVEREAEREAESEKRWQIERY